MDSVMQVQGPFGDPFEVPRRILEAGTKPILFTNPFGDGRNVVSNAFATRERLALCLNVADAEFLRFLGRLTANPCGKYEGVDMDSFEKKGGGALPAFQYYRADAGKYVTSSVVLAEDPDSRFVNMSVHRMLVLNHGRFAIRMVEGRHLHRIFTKNKERGKDTPVAILVGCMPHVLIASCCQLEWGMSEMRLASALADGKLSVVEPPGLGFSVPTDTEYLLTGKISKDETVPEKQVDVLGITDAERAQPVVHIASFHQKQDPIYHAIMPGGYEHRVLMGVPRAAAIWSSLEKGGIDVRDVSLTPGSGGWLHCVISMRKKGATEGKDAVLTALLAHSSVKGVIVVDEDVDPNTYESIDFALATRLRSKGQLMTFEGLRGSTLDPSADRHSYATLKWGLDLTLEMGEEKNRFKKEPPP